MAQSAPFARLTRGGFGFSRHETTKENAEEEEDWYIPYNGPYEAPREPARRTRRDSWGDPVDEYEEYDTMLADGELHKRYGGHSDYLPQRAVEDERESRSRDRTFSMMSGRTTSSGAVDPNRNSLATQRRSTVSTGQRPPIPSYINPGSIGGVGESPAPQTKNVKEGNRISLASIFNLGGNVRKATSSPLLSAVGRKNTGSSRRFGSPHSRQSSSTDSRARRPSESSAVRQTGTISISATDEEDYYNSYYSTLEAEGDNKKANSLQPRSPISSAGSYSSHSPQQVGLSRQPSTSTTSAPHPYAYVFTRNDPTPSREPPAQLTFPTIASNQPPRLTFTNPKHQQKGPNSADAVHPAFSSRLAVDNKSLKNSTSTPDLRSPPAIVMPVQATSKASKPSGFQFPKGRDRWLSPETWCDALLFPRPRLKLKQEPVEGPIPESSGRIVSPPGSPLGEDFGDQHIQEVKRGPSIASRVLAHSRSLVDLNKGRSKPEELQNAYDALSKDLQTSKAGSTLRPPRPKSFAQDDLALLAPVPSLAHVLREGVQLQTERREWQLQATKSFGNKHARSMSRTRTKSLTHKGRKGHQHQSSMEYIAARACLGTQNISPSIAPAQFNFDSNVSNSNHTTATSSIVTTGKHQGSNTVLRSVPTYGQTQSHTHSRNESWGKTAMKVAKSTVICGVSTSDAESISPSFRGREHVNGGVNPTRKAADLEGALRMNDTKVIRLADPALIVVDRGLAPSSDDHHARRQTLTPSPTYSGISESKIGIAIGTPPSEESGFIPNHPYANGGLSFRHTDGPLAKPDIGGPHPSTVNPTLPFNAISGVNVRQKQPPPMTLHPYAQTELPARDSYIDANGLIGQYRSQDTTPHPSKMWAQLSPDGLVREVLPNDIVYSPFSPDKRYAATPRTPVTIHDTIGVGETLVNATRFESDEDRIVIQPETHEERGEQGNWDQEDDQIELPEFGPSTTRRNGMQFHTIRPTDLEREGQKPSDPITLASSQLEYKNNVSFPPQTTASSPLEYTGHPSFDLGQSSNTGPFSYASHHQVDRAQSTSPATSRDSSPQPLGSPNDLESFQDLFYRPRTDSTRRTPNEAALPETPLPSQRASTTWELNMPNRRTGSTTLTTLARQLSDEFEQMALEHARENEGNRWSQPNTVSSHQNSDISRRPTEGSLQFLFEGMSNVETSPEDGILSNSGQAFKASETLPEDVESSRASSFIENTEEEETARYRIGLVESVSTPPAVASEHEVPFFDGHTAFVQDHQRPVSNSDDLGSPISNERILSLLQPPTEATRSSYMTTSTLSRMSNLSDFPAPPKDDYHTPEHTSIFSAYYGKSLSQIDSQSRLAQSSLLEEERVTFGINQNANDVANTLSSNPSS